MLQIGLATTLGYNINILMNILNLSIQILFYITIAFGGYIIGRWSHCYLNVWLKNPKWAPHHWVYGFIFIILSLIFSNIFLGLLSLSLGIGFFISDLKDFLRFKFIGPDEEGQKKFWGID